MEVKSERKYEIALMLMVKFWREGYVHILHSFVNDGEVRTDEHTPLEELRAYVRRIKEGEKDDLVLKQIAMIWLAHMFIRDSKLGFGSGCGRIVGNHAKAIGIETAELKEMYLEILIERLRKDYR
ncbi:MAG: hypothetical protein PHF79_00390 [Candidatus Pacebacteria bacterium]|nr:hypothetical protein [Candidatus Paceibacterota bacterium]